MILDGVSQADGVVSRLDRIARKRMASGDQPEWMSWANLSADDLDLVQQDLSGRFCRLRPRDSERLIELGDERTIILSVPWRIFADGHIALGSDDNGSNFGIDKPLDGRIESRLLLGGKKLTRVAIDPHTADLALHFDDQTRLDAFNTSSGYEGWRARCQIRDRWVWVIGSGGGQVRVVFLNH